jgi:hypothetical protein
MKLGDLRLDDAVPKKGQTLQRKVDVRAIALEDQHRAGPARRVGLEQQPAALELAKRVHLLLHARRELRLRVDPGTARQITSSFTR